MKIAKFAIILSCFISIGCASIEMVPQTFKNYSINKIQEVNIGSPIIRNENIKTLKGRRWVGLINSRDGWEYTERVTDDSFREELIYTGKSGSTIFISYREYRKEFARPAFYHEVRYDLSSSSTVVFRQYRIKVIEATNEIIRYMVLAD